MPVSPMSEVDLSIKNEILERTRTILDGQLFEFGNFLFFRQGHYIGAAIPTGENYLNVHNIRPVKSFILDSARSVLHANGNHLTLAVDDTELDLSDTFNASVFADMMVLFTKVTDNERAKIIANPRAWAENVANTLGNSFADIRPYPYVAELYLVNKFKDAGLMCDVQREYRGPDAGVHDFELEHISMEVKSHLHANRDDKPGELVVSSVHQLSPTGTKPLYVVYFKMEEGGDLSLERCVENFGEHRQTILGKLKKQNFVEGDFAWPKSYNLLGQPQVYEIDANFPKITETMFKGDHFPSGITKLIYHVSLKNLPFCNLADFIATLQTGKRPVFRVQPTY
jgi:hypothetical protein